MNPNGYLEYFSAISTGFYTRPRLCRMGMAVFVSPTSNSTCMHRRSTLVRDTPCLPAMDAQLLTILDFQDAKA